MLVSAPRWIILQEYLDFVRMSLLFLHFLTCLEVIKCVNLIVYA